MNGTLRRTVPNDPRLLIGALVRIPGGRTARLQQYYANSDRFEVSDEGLTLMFNAEQLRHNDAPLGDPRALAGWMDEPEWAFVEERYEAVTYVEPRPCDCSCQGCQRGNLHLVLGMCTCEQNKCHCMTSGPL